MRMDREKVNGHDYLSNGKKSQLPHCLRGVITQVLIVLQRHDGRNLLRGMFGVFAEEDELFLLINRQSLHEAFTSLMLH